MTETTTTNVVDPVQDREALFIDGGWVAPAGGHATTSEVTNAGDGTRLATVTHGSSADVDRAVAAASAAGEAWSAEPVEVRAAMIEAIADEVEHRADALAHVIALEVGTPVRVAQALQVGLPLMVLRAYARELRDMPQDEQIGNSTISHSGVGVVGAITPWNYPLHQVAAKLGAALAAGCAVVLKPSEVAPLSAFVLAEAVDAAGLPAGLFNVVSGTGSDVGEAIAGHPDIAAVSFTGSTRAGARVAALAAANITRVSLELGGKSASIIAADADLEVAVKASVRNAFTNSGQTCSAWTRMLVPRERLADVEDIAAAELAKLVVGHPLASDSRLGPLASANQQAAVQVYLQRAESEGLRSIGEGQISESAVHGGFYVRPTIFTDVPRDSTLARDEIFGPVLTILTHDGLDDAVELANASAYGLAGAIWSADTDQAMVWAKRMRTGQVDINGGRFNARAPFGGHGKSGIGRELGRHGIAEFLEITSVQV